MLLRIKHRTAFNYSESVSDTVFEVRKAPVSSEDQTLLNFELKITPNAPLMSYRDGFGNRVDLFNVIPAYKTLLLESTGLVRTHRRTPIERLAGLTCDAQGNGQIEAIEFLGRSPLIDRSAKLDALVAELPTPEGPILAYLERLLQTLRESLAYEKKVTDERTPLSEALELGRGVCQDFAHLCIGTCRALGIPARYVSGYVNHPGEIATHAWTQVWCGPHAGWVDVDPTTARFADDDHVVVAIGRDYSDVPPNRGVWKGVADETMDVAVTVEVMDRLPDSWDDWSSEAARRTLAAQPPNRPRSTIARADDPKDWPAYPNQPQPQTLLYRQQGQQQQQQQR